MANYENKIANFDDYEKENNAIYALAEELNERGLLSEEKESELEAMLSKVDAKYNTDSTDMFFDKSDLLHEIQHAIQGQEGFASGGNVEQFQFVKHGNLDEEKMYLDRKAELDKELMSYMLELLPMKKSGEITADELKSSMEKRAKELNIPAIEAALKNGRDPFQAYQRLAGEIESRNVEKRLNLTAEQRRNTPPSQTQDMPDSEAIVVWNGTEMHSAPANAGSGIRYSFAQTATDYFTGKPRRTTSLSDIDTMLNTGKQPTDKLGWQYYADLAVTTFTDSTRPFARFVQDTFEAAHASKLLSGADRALGMKAAYEKEAMNLFGRPIADGIRAIVKATKMDYKTAKDLAGYWMSAKYAIDANDWLMEKDQQAIDDLNAEIAKTTDPAELKMLNKQLAKATNEQAKRIAAINNPAIVDPTKQKQEAGLAGGFNNVTAKEYMAKIEAKIALSQLEAVANPIYDMNQWKLKRDIEDGKISQATADKFPKYRHYVPLTGDPRTDDSVDDHFATGSVNQAKDKAIGGRTGSIAQNGIDASFEQLEKSARYHGWNDFKTALTDAYEQLIADKLAMGMKQKDAEQAVFDEFSIKRRAETGMMPAGENDITVRKDGKGMIYTICNQAAMEAFF
ncbi:MAG: hypothetical protein Q8Q54_17475 [Methylococcales bacterium]|nr:hypothetical protein [Methylococcales bacterium]